MYVMLEFIGSTRNSTMMSALQKKISFRMMLIFIWVSRLISKIGIFGTQKTHTWYYRSQCSHYKCVFDETCGALPSLAIFFFENEVGGDIYGTKISGSTSVCLMKLVERWHHWPYFFENEDEGDI